MVHHKNQSKNLPKLTPIIAASVMVVTSIIGPSATRADQFDSLIKQKQDQKAQAQAQASVLGQQAQGIQGEINLLQDQIASIQAQIDTNTARQNDLTTQIDAAQKKLEDQKSMLSANIRSMYIEGDISPLEMIASSKNLGDFVDKQEYRDRIKDSISTTMDEIEALKIQLDEQKREITRILDEQKTLRGTLDQKNNEAGAKLASVNQDKAAFDSRVSSLSNEIMALRAQQRAANARFIGSDAGVSCGGGYPGARSDGHRLYNGGRWGCNYGLDVGVDPWGMFSRQCVSYTAFKVAQSGRNMPHWGGQGNAWEWAYGPEGYPGRIGLGNNAQRAGIPVDNNPRVGDVAVSNNGFYGHVMYVEAVNSDGTIDISQYNADWKGTYSYVPGISPNGLRFIHF